VFKAIKEAKQRIKNLSAFAGERFGVYVDLVRVEVELQVLEAKAQLVALILFALSALFAIFFLFLALVISFWETEYRIAVAWGIVAFYVVISGLAYWRYLRRPKPEPLFMRLHNELREDIALAKEMV
jgi:uncharacterized membrane protein YqjE